MLDQGNLNFLPPIKSNEFLPQISRWTTWGGLMMIGTCSLSLYLAATLKFPISIQADGTVRPTGELRLVQATSSGIIQSILTSENQFVKKGQAIATIAPSNASLVIKAHVAPREINNIKICKDTKVRKCSAGQVQLRISAYPYPDYGTLKAGVRAIASDTITKETNPNHPYYQVTIEPERSFLIRGKSKYPLQSGMEVTAEIISRKETMLAFILRKARLLGDFSSN